MWTYGFSSDQLLKVAGFVNDEVESIEEGSRGDWFFKADMIATTLAEYAYDAVALILVVSLMLGYKLCLRKLAKRESNAVLDTTADAAMALWVSLRASVLVACGN